MKKFALPLMTAVALSVAVPAYAAQEKTGTGKDLCLLYSRNCAQRVDTIQEKIGKLRTEIAKGTRVYTPKEIERLEQKLKEAEKQLDYLLYGPAGK